MSEYWTSALSFKHFKLGDSIEGSVLAVSKADDGRRLDREQGMETPGKVRCAVSSDQGGG